MTEEKKQFSEKDLEALFERAGKMGALLMLMHFDSFGREKEIVKASLVELISRINAEKGVLYCRGEVEEVLETEDEKGKGYTTYTEVKVMTINFDVAIGLCMKFGPVAVEILEPKELKLSQEQMQNALLNASSISQHFTTYFMNKILKDDELSEFQKNLEKRIEHGKKLMEKGEKESADKKKE